MTKPDIKFVTCGGVTAILIPLLNFLENGLILGLNTQTFGQGSMTVRNMSCPEFGKSRIGKHGIHQGHPGCKKVQKIKGP